MAPFCSSHQAGSFKSSFKDRSRIDPGSILDRSWIDPGSILDRSRIDPGSILDRSWKLLDQSRNDPGSILDRSMGPHGAPRGAPFAKKTLLLDKKERLFCKHRYYIILSEWGGGPTAYFTPGRVGWGAGPRQIVVCLPVVCRLPSVCPRPTPTDGSILDRYWIDPGSIQDRFWSDAGSIQAHGSHGPMGPMGLWAHWPTAPPHSYHPNGGLICII